MKKLSKFILKPSFQYFWEKQPIINFKKTVYIPGDRRFTKSDHATRDRDIDLKPILLDETLLQLPPAETTWMVGDTEADIRSARACNIPIISVLSGIRDRQILKEFEPDYIVENLLEAVKLIQTKL